MEFLPITRREMLDRGWDACDFVYIIGDAYVDHPSFGHAIISRVLESHGYNVGIISQPDWKNPEIHRRFRPSPAGVSGLRRQYGLHGQPLFRHQSTTGKPTPSPPAALWASARTTPPRSTATLSARPTRTFPFSSAALRRVCAGWRITITGRTRIEALHFAGQPGRPAACTAWGNRPSWRWPTP